MSEIKQISRAISSMKTEVSDILQTLADIPKYGDDRVAEAVVEVENALDMLDHRFHHNRHVVEYYAPR